MRPMGGAVGPRRPFGRAQTSRAGKWLFLRVFSSRQFCFSLCFEKYYLVIFCEKQARKKEVLPSFSLFMKFRLIRRNVHAYVIANYAYFQRLVFPPKGPTAPAPEIPEKLHTSVHATAISTRAAREIKPVQNARLSGFFSRWLSRSATTCAGSSSKTIASRNATSSGRLRLPSLMLDRLDLDTLSRFASS